mgnify:CR=1 FL=1
MGSVPLCAVVGALGSDCCQTPCADDAQDAASDDPGDLSSAVVVEAAHGTDSDCSCPFECAFGCCSPTRAVVEQAVTLDHAMAAGERLALSEVEQTPPSPEARGILHVPKLAA